MKNNRISLMTAGASTVIFLALLFTIFSIYSSSYIAYQAKVMYEHPYPVKNATEVMRTRLSEMKLYFPSLLAANYNNSDEIIQLLKLRDKRQDNSLEIISRLYLGSQNDVVELTNALKKVRQARIRAVEACSGNDSLEEIIAYVEREVNPYSNAVDNVLIRIGDTVNKRVRFIGETAQQTQATSTIGAIVLCALIIALVIFTNINERKKNQAIAYRERLFDLVANNIDDVFFIYNFPDKRTEYVSENSMRILDIDKSYFYNDTLYIKNYLDPDSKELLDSLLLNGSLLNNAECDLKYKKDNLSLSLKIRIYPILNGNKIQRYIAVLSDQTKIIEHQKTLSDALISAQNANNAKRNFLSRMSHEIRTPMNTIIGMTSIAFKHIDDLSYVENCLKKITYSSGHLLALINDILDMSKIEDNKLSITNELFDLRKLVESVTTIIYPQTADKKQNFEVTVSGLIDEKLIGDSLRVNQILINLLSNAVKFTPQSGQIRLEIIKLRENNNQVYLRFVVRDTGIGMSEEFLGRLYSPFEQADNSIAQKYGGSGLGMSITKNLVSLMNGTISVSSKEGSGTEFVVELPFELSEHKKTQSQEFNHLNVLIVDDDKNTCEHATIVMEQIGLHASWVCSGREAITSVKNAHDMGKDFDVCFIDWCMPEMDGIETTRNIRNIIGTETLIIIISAFDWSDIESEAREAGANAFISKPLFASSISTALNTVSWSKHAVVTNETSDNMLYNFNGKKILLAEDNIINQEIAIILLNDVGIVVECAENGEEALQMFEKSKEGEYSMILMDIQMPKMNGYEAARAIRKSMHKVAKTIPIIAMTANAFNDDVTAALESGMNGHISKPIDVDILYSTVASYIV